MSDNQRSYRKRTAKEKAEIVLAGLRADRSVRDVCREHEISETLDYQWKEKLLAGGQAARSGKDECQAEKELRTTASSTTRRSGSHERFAPADAEAVERA